MSLPDNNQAPSPRNILIATAIAFGVGVVLLFVAILPAEFGSDPLGTGRLLGLNALSAEQNERIYQRVVEQAQAERELGIA